MKCPLCYSSRMHYYLRPRRGRSVYICDSCTNAFTVPTPEVVYDDNQFFEGALRDTDRFRIYARQVLDFVGRQHPPGKLLDIGTGGGYLVEEAMARGWDALGLEPSVRAVAFCRSRGVPVRQGYLGQVKLPRNSFDCVVASHVLEHVPDPLQFLRAVRHLLKPKGILILCQTNYQGTLARVYRSYWESWVPNEHLVHFSPAGIRNVLTADGWKIQGMEILPLGYYPRWVWGGTSVIATNVYYTLSYLISTLRVGFPFKGDQIYVAAKPMGGTKK